MAKAADDRPALDMESGLRIPEKGPVSSLAKPAMTSDAMKPACEVCEHGNFVGENFIGTCMLKPPEHFMFLAPRKVMADGLAPYEPVSYSQQPFVNRKQWCALHFALRASSQQ